MVSVSRLCRGITSLWENYWWDRRQLLLTVSRTILGCLRQVGMPWIWVTWRSIWANFRKMNYKGVIENIFWVVFTRPARRMKESPGCSWWRHMVWIQSGGPNQLYSSKIPMIWISIRQVPKALYLTCFWNDQQSCSPHAGCVVTEPAAFNLLQLIFSSQIFTFIQHTKVFSFHFVSLSAASHKLIDSDILF